MKLKLADIIPTHKIVMYMIKKNYRQTVSKIFENIIYSQICDYISD